MKTTKIILVLLLMGGIALGLRGFIFFEKKEKKIIDNEIQETETKETENHKVKEVEDTEVPIDRVNERITKKKFGDFITPQNSPVQPERFSGYHTGVDLEILEGEDDETVTVRVICDGELAAKRSASGYGGLVVQKCDFDGEKATVIYGHLDISSVELEIGDKINTSEVLGELGEGGSAETDRERKHLHLGIYRGEKIDIKGYVKSKEELINWIDPCLYICNKNN